ncbi:hypothetical protein [Metabacillus idriensis]|uniref:hypothetical protein n=1 Tax=Metabacillus idriensis TaxID=324768 RepID=UPI00174C5B67|nr:hypothetical protein [Metabacillus idriensis]
MTHSLTKPKWGLFAALVLLIAGSNAAIYRFPFMQPVPQGAALGSLLDFLVVIPLLTYLFILRKRYSLTYLLPVILAGYGFARFLIPAQQVEAYSFIPWLLFACEALVLLAEIFILILFFKKLPRIIGDYKLNIDLPFFFPKAKAVFEKHVPSNRLGYPFYGDFHFLLCFLQLAEKSSTACRCLFHRSSSNKCYCPKHHADSRNCH